MDPGVPVGRRRDDRRHPGPAGRRRRQDLPHHTAMLSMAGHTRESGPEWDVAVIGAGPAGLAAASACVAAGARTIVLERARHPRYKTCGGGLIGASLTATDGFAPFPERDRIHAATFTP